VSCGLQKPNVSSGNYKHYWGSRAEKSHYQGGLRLKGSRNADRSSLPRRTRLGETVAYFLYRELCRRATSLYLSARGKETYPIQVCNAETPPGSEMERHDGS